jgi:hypothetical protein
MGIGGDSSQVFGFKGLAGKVFINQSLGLSKSAENGFGAVSRVERSFPFGFAQGQDFGSGLPPSTTLRVTPAKRLNLGTAPIRSLSSRVTGLMSMDFDQGAAVTVNVATGVDVTVVPVGLG